MMSRPWGYSFFSTSLTDSSLHMFDAGIQEQVHSKLSVKHQPMPGVAAARRQLLQQLRDQDTNMNTPPGLAERTLASASCTRTLSLLSDAVHHM
jgi:hypothetical protein